MALNAAELLAKVRQRKKKLNSWEWWNTAVGDKIYQDVNRSHNDECDDPEQITTLHLTSDERKRQKRLNRLTQEDEHRKRIKSGLEKAPPPKSRVKNVQAVFGAAYFQDPTKYELLVKKAEEERHQEHMERNEARKLSAEDKWEKHIEKVRKNRAEGSHCVAVKMPPVNSKEQYIIDYTSKKYELTGALLLSENDAYLVSEGGGPEILKCEKLSITKFKSHLLWKGQLSKANFARWSIHTSPDRKSFLKAYGVDSIFETV